MLNWPRVTKGSNLSMTDEKMEWLLNYLPPPVLEGNNVLGAGSVVGLGIQSALLVSVWCEVRGTRKKGAERPVLMVVF